MLKKSILALVALAGLQVASAQTYGAVDSVVTVESKNTDKYRVETNRFGSNWFIGFGIGGQIYFGDHDKQMAFLDRLAPGAELYVGKWFTPGIGVRVGLAYGRHNGISGWTGHNAINSPNTNMGNYRGFIKNYKYLGNGNFTGEVYTNPVGGHRGYPLYVTQMDYLHARADVMFNLSNMIFGYNPERFYSFIPYASVGFAHSLDRAPISEKYSHEVNGGIGLLNRFRLSSAFDLNLDVRATYVGDHFDQEDISANHGGLATNTAGRYGEGILSATIGLSYNFPKRGWERSTITTIRVNENVLADLRERVGQLQETNDDLRRQLQAALNREVTKENVAAQPLLVTFPIDRWTLSNKDRVNLGFLAEVIKANPNMVYSVTGFADRGTGSVKRNVFLARKRAEVIYDCLVKEFGVSESQLRKDSKGGVENMYYDDPRCSRAVLLKLGE